MFFWFRQLDLMIMPFTEREFGERQRDCGFSFGYTTELEDPGDAGKYLEED